MKKQVMFMIFMILMTGAFATTIYIPEDYVTIQAGIDASEDGDEIIVSPGTYVENINFAGKAVILGSLFYTTQDTSYISQTIIDGNQNDSAVTFESEEDSTSVLTGFTITNGNAYYGGGIYSDSSSPSLENVKITDNSGFFGSGILCYYSSPNLENVTISGNSALFDGGGISCKYSSSPTLENVTITGNSAVRDGGGIFCEYSSSPSLENVTITDNSAGDDGGGIFCVSYSSAILENVTITDNSANAGGGIYCRDNSSPSLVNVAITGNSAVNAGGGICCFYYSSLILENVKITNNSAGYGGGIDCNGSNPSLNNVTITNNLAGNSGGGIFCQRSSNPILVNCIFWNNLPQEVEFLSIIGPNTITIAYSDIAGGEEGIVTNNNGTVNWLEGNIDAAPLFVDALVGNYHLTEDSPCIDTGIAYFEYDGDVLVDLSEDEYWGIAPDMGAYEYGMVATDEFIIESTQTDKNVESKIRNYPNPFNPETNIVFDISFGSNVLIEIYNIKGQKVTTLVNGPFEAGSHKVTWNAVGQSSGIYLLRFNTAETSEMKKLILLK